MILADFSIRPTRFVSKVPLPRAASSSSTTAAAAATGLEARVVGTHDDVKDVIFRDFTWKLKLKKWNYGM